MDNTKKSCSVSLPPEAHKSLRIQAIKRGVTLAQVLEEAVLYYLSKTVKEEAKTISQ